jgi:hypothetical protein
VLCSNKLFLQRCDIRANRKAAKLPGLFRQADRSFCAGERKLSGAAAQKIEPQFSALFDFLMLTLAFDVRGFMRELTKAKVALSM